MRAVWKCVWLLLMAALLIGVAELAIQVSDRSPAATDAIVEIMPNIVEQGEPFQLDVKVFYRRACQVNVIRKLYDANGEKYALPELALPAGAPGLQHSVSTIVISPNFAIGDGRYVSSPKYSCNWFQRVFWPISVPDRIGAFQVIKHR